MMLDEMSTARWAKEESARIAEIWPMGDRRETELIAHWRLNRPKMVARLERLGVLKELAHVLHNKMVQAIRANVAAGLPPTDAREEAARDWLMMDPEDESEKQVFE